MATLYTIETQQQNSQSNDPIVFSNVEEMLSTIGMPLLSKIATIDAPTKRIVDTGYTLKQLEELVSECATLKQKWQEKANECQEKANECQEKVDELKKLQESYDELKREFVKKEAEFRAQETRSNQLETKLSSYTAIIKDVNKMSSRPSLTGVTTTENLATSEETVEKGNIEERREIGSTNKRSACKNAPDIKRRRNN